MGGRAPDIVWSAGLFMCFSERLIDLLLENRFTGWGTYPVEVYGKKDEYLPGYHGFSVRSFAGVEDLNRSEVFWRPRYPFFGSEPIPFFRGMYFREELWDGSDFFRVTTAHIVVTRRVMEAFKKAKIRNVKFIALPEKETPRDTFERDGKVQERFNYHGE
jgi:hypothetical protein